ncbi:C39 family peptidase [Candidatus Saccharibacteria bacterium]|nr:C39 family peptidase [Candidatus Saccharibacteria bacterium]
MVKKSKSPSKTPKTTPAARRRTATTKAPIRVHRYDEAPDKYRHYSAYRPSGSKTTKKTAPDMTIRRHPTAPAPAKRRPRSEILRRRRIVVTIVVCLLVILGAAVAKIWVGDTPKTDQPETVGIESTKPTEPPPKSEIELKKDLAEQNLKTIGSVFESTKFSADSLVKLKIPVYKQVYGQSCEAAALRMALAYRGIETTDLKILELMKYDDQPATKIDGQWRWGDPHKMYVGHKDGDQTKMTGYGVFAEPIAAVSEQLGRPADVQNEVKPEWLARQIYAGNPVVLWGISIKIADAKWTTPDGREIVAPMRTHTRLVVGVRGDPNQPSGFYLNDPAGLEIYWTTSQLVTNSQQGINQAVAIY